MTWSAMGRAASSPSPPFSTMAQTAIWGSSAGAKVIHQECGASAVSAVPVFPAPLGPGDLGRRQAAFGDHTLNHTVELAGRTRVERLVADAGGRPVEDDPVRRADLAHDAGLHHLAVVGDGRGDQSHLEG